MFLNKLSKWKSRGRILTTCKWAWGTRCQNSTLSELDASREDVDSSMYEAAGFVTNAIKVHVLTEHDANGNGMYAFTEHGGRIHKHKSETCFGSVTLVM